MKSLPAFCRLSILVSQGFLSTLSFLSAQAVNIHVIFQSLMFFCILHTFLSAAGSPLWFKKKSDKMASFPIMRLCQQSKPAWRCLNIVVCDRWAVSVTQSSSTCSLFFLKVTDPPPVIAYSGGVQHSSKWEICKSAYFCFAKGFICVEGFSHRAQDLWGLQSSSRLSLSWRKKKQIRGSSTWTIQNIFSFLTSTEMCSFT